MDIRLHLKYQLTLSPTELRLLQRALAGKLTEEDMPHALRLQEKMAYRATQVPAEGEP